MKRREFFKKSSCSVFTLMLAYFGLTSCKKEATIETQSGQSPTPAPPPKEMDEKEMVKQMLMTKMGKTEEEADAMIADFEAKLPMIKEKCICKTCPTYVAEETGLGFCSPLAGQSKIITEEKGCDCPKCPVYAEMALKNGYYCTRKSEMEQNVAKMVMKT